MKRLMIYIHSSIILFLILVNVSCVQEDGISCELQKKEIIAKLLELRAVVKRIDTEKDYIKVIDENYDWADRKKNSIAACMGISIASTSKNSAASSWHRMATAVSLIIVSKKHLSHNGESWKSSKNSLIKFIDEMEKG